MAVEQPNLNAYQSNIARETRILPPGDLLVGPNTLEQLKIPDAVALSPQNVLQFLASQSARLQGVIKPDEIKSMEADIPPYLHDESAPMHAQSGISREERLAVQSLGSLMTQSGDIDYDQLQQEVAGTVDELVKKYPMAEAVTGGGPDALEMMLDNTLLQETEEQKKKMMELLAAAKGDPQMTAAIIGFQHASRVQKKLGALLQMYQFHVADQAKIAKELDMKGTKGGPSAADLAGINIDFQRSATDTNVIMQSIQMAVNDYERITVSTKTLVDLVGKPTDTMINNMRL